VLAKLRHSGIAQLLDAGITSRGQPFLVLELVHGERIDHWCDKHELSVKERVKLFVQVLDAVSAAHSQLVIHRDLKPSNILIDRDGRAKLLDFGIARLVGDELVPGLTREGAMALTPEFAAPEQFTAGPLTVAADVYGLGVVLFSLLTGVHPSGITRGTPINHMRAAIEGNFKQASERCPAQRDALKGDLDNILAKALRPSPQERYVSAAAFAQDLQRHLNNEPVSARDATWTYRSGRFVRRHRLGVAVVSIVAVLLVAAAGTTAWEAKEAARARQEAETRSIETQAANDFMSVMLSEVGLGGRPLSPVELVDRGKSLLLQKYVGDPHFVANMLMQLSDRYSELQDTVKETETKEQGISLARSLNAPSLSANLLCQSVSGDLGRGDKVLAQKRLSEALSVLAGIQNPDSALKTSCLTGQSDMANATGHFDESVTYMEEAAKVSETEGNPQSMDHATILFNLADAYEMNNNIQQAYATRRRGAEIMDSAGRGGTQGRIITMHGEARLLARLGEVRLAESIAREAIRRQQGSDVITPSGSSSPAMQYGRLLLTLGEVSKAKDWLTYALSQAQHNQNLLQEDRAHLNLARVYIEQGRPDLALRELNTARASWDQDKAAHVGDLRQCQLVSAQWYLAQKQFAKAKQEIMSLLANVGWPKNIGSPLLIESLQVAAVTSLALGELVPAQSYSEAAVQAAEKFSRDPALSAFVGEAKLIEGQIAYAQSNFAKAVSLFRGAQMSLTSGLGPDKPASVDAVRWLAQAESSQRSESLHGGL
jgi:serine/threonine-protein kinase